MCSGAGDLVAVKNEQAVVLDGQLTSGSLVGGQVLLLDVWLGWTHVIGGVESAGRWVLVVSFMQDCSSVMHSVWVTNCLGCNSGWLFLQLFLLFVCTMCFWYLSPLFSFVLSWWCPSCSWRLPVLDGLVGEGDSTAAFLSAVFFVPLLLACSCFYAQDMVFLFGAVLADCLRFQVDAWVSFSFLFWVRECCEIMCWKPA